jgi:predicted transcriptional regulator
VTVLAIRLKLPRRLKSRIERLARQGGESTHSFMLRALRAQVEVEERYQTFLREGVEADHAMQQSGVGYGADAVHAYLESRAQGRKARRRRPVRRRG